MADNPIRNCIGCGQVDDHPRHHVSVGDTDVFWHMDCHARSGQGCDLCKAVTESHDGLTGDELRTHIENNDPAKRVLIERGLVATPEA